MSVSRLLSSSCELGLISARERAVFPSSRFGVCARDCDRFGNCKQRKKLDPMDGDRQRRAPLKSRHPDLKEKVRIVCALPPSVDPGLLVCFAPGCLFSLKL